MLEMISKMIKEGKTYGKQPYWRLDVEKEISEEGTFYIAGLIEKGYTTGYEPCSWNFVMEEPEVEEEMELDMEKELEEEREEVQDNGEYELEVESCEQYEEELEEELESSVEVEHERTVFALGCM
jgi:DNA-binding Lrp family transcriptional regulator